MQVTLICEDSKLESLKSQLNEKTKVIPELQPASKTGNEPGTHWYVVMTTDEQGLTDLKTLKDCTVSEAGLRESISKNKLKIIY